MVHSRYHYCILQPVEIRIEDNDHKTFLNQTDIDSWSPASTKLISVSLERQWCNFGGTYSGI